MSRPTLHLLVAGLLLAASPTPGWAQNPTAIPSGGGWVSRFIPLELLLRMRERPEGVEDAVLITAPLDSVWVAARAALEAVGLPIGFEDRANGEIGHARAKLYRRLGKQPLSTFLSCGSGMAGPNADSYAVYLSFVAFVKPAGGGQVAVAPLLTAQAVDLAGGRNDPIWCTSTGRLEKRIGAELRRRLDAPPPGSR